MRGELETLSAAPPESLGGDRISQLLAEGQRAFDAERYQDAIDCWSRIFLIEIDHDENEQVRVTISDDGPGVPPELRERIFDAFVSGSVKGSGLGLYLSRCIAEQHGGSLTLSEAPRERGAAFVVTLLKGGIT